MEREKGFEPSASSLGSWHSLERVAPRSPDALIENPSDAGQSRIGLNDHNRRAPVAPNRHSQAQKNRDNQFRPLLGGALEDPN